VSRIHIPKIYFGWWTVIACGIAALVGIGFVSMGFSVFFKPMAEELNLSRAVTSIAASVQSVTGASMALLGGWASDKYGPRRVMVTGIIILVFGFLMMYFVNSLWSFLLVWGVLIGAGFNLSVTIITDRAIINWFVKKSGIAINTKFAIQALAGVLLLPFIAWLVTTFNWQITCIIGGTIIAIVCLPLLWFFVKPHRPEYYGLLPDGEKTSSGVIQNSNVDGNLVQPEADDFTLGQAIKSFPFWLLIIIGFASNLLMPMMGAHAVPFLTDDGKFTTVQAAQILGWNSTISIPARLITGLIVDRLKTNRLRFVMIAGYCLQIIGVSFFLLTRSNFAIWIWFILFGLGQGISQSANLPLIGRYFGRKSFGKITGLSSMIQMPISLIGPVYVGWVYDTTGSYNNVIVLMSVLLVISGILIFFLIPPKSPARSLSTAGDMSNK